MDFIFNCPACISVRRGIGIDVCSKLLDPRDFVPKEEWSNKPAVIHQLGSYRGIIVDPLLYHWAFPRLHPISRRWMRRGCRGFTLLPGMGFGRLRGRPKPPPPRGPVGDIISCRCCHHEHPLVTRASLSSRVALVSLMLVPHIRSYLSLRPLKV